MSSRAVETAAAFMTLGQTEDLVSMSILYEDLNEDERKALTFFLAGMTYDALQREAGRQKIPLDRLIRGFGMQMAVLAENIRSTEK